MLRIDRVTTEMDVLPSPAPPTAGAPRSPVEAALSDPLARERVKVLVLEVLRDHLHDLQRQGVV